MNSVVQLVYSAMKSSSLKKYRNKNKGLLTELAVPNGPSTASLKEKSFVQLLGAGKGGTDI